MTTEQPKKKKPDAPAEVRALPAQPTPGSDIVVGVTWAPSKAFPPRRMDGSLEHREAIALRLIFTGLESAGAEIPSASKTRPPTPVSSPFRAIRYILSKIADDLRIDETGQTPLCDTYSFNLRPNGPYPGEAP